MESILLVALGFAGGISLGLLVALGIDVLTKGGRAPSLFRTCAGSIVGGLAAVAIGMIAPLQLLHLIPLHERFVFYMIGFGLGVLVFRVVSSGRGKGRR